MPKIKTSGLDELIQVLGDLSDDVTGICKMGLYDGAKILADEISASIPVGESGDLKASFGIAKFRHDNGSVETIIGFDGYDSRGTPNRLKARALESGRSFYGKTVGKHPFIRAAVRRARAAAVNAIQDKIEEQIKNIIGG